MQDPTYEVHYTHKGQRGMRPFGALDAREALNFAKSLPAGANASMVKVQEVWSRAEQTNNPAPEPKITLAPESDRRACCGMLKIQAHRPDCDGTVRSRR